jgi:hypothetical protein
MRPKSAQIFNKKSCDFFAARKFLDRLILEVPLIVLQYYKPSFSLYIYIYIHIKIKKDLYNFIKL